MTDENVDIAMEVLVRKRTSTSTGLQEVPALFFVTVSSTILATFFLILIRTQLHCM